MALPDTLTDTRFSLGRSELPTAWFNVAPHEEYLGGNLVDEPVA